MQIQRVIPDGHPATEPLAIELTSVELAEAHWAWLYNMHLIDARCHLEKYFELAGEAKSEEALLRFQNTLGVPYDTAIDLESDRCVLHDLVEAFLYKCDADSEAEDDAWARVVREYVQDVNDNGMCPNYEAVGDCPPC